MNINRKNIFILIAVTLLLGISTIFGTYAFLSWNSNEVTSFNVVTDPTLEKYIIYDEGDSQIVGDFF